MLISDNTQCLQHINRLRYVRHDDNCMVTYKVLILKMMHITVQKLIPREGNYFDILFKQRKVAKTSQAYYCLHETVYVFVLLDHVPVITIFFCMFVFVDSLLFTVVTLRFTE